MDISLIYQFTYAASYITAIYLTAHDLYIFHPRSLYNQAARPSTPAASGTMPPSTASAAPPVLMVAVVVVLASSVPVIGFSVVVCVPDPVGASVTDAESSSTGAAL